MLSYDERSSAQRNGCSRSSIEAGKKRNMAIRIGIWISMRDTSAHGVDARLLVELHRRLLLFHGVLLLAGISCCQLVDLRFDQAHLGHRNVTLVGERRDDELHQDHQDQDDDAEAGDIVAQEVEDRNHAPAVHPAEDTPAQRNQALQVQFRTVRSSTFLRMAYLFGPK